jgi:hypothetical protein
MMAVAKMDDKIVIPFPAHDLLFTENIIYKWRYFDLLVGCSVMAGNHVQGLRYIKILMENGFPPDEQQRIINNYHYLLETSQQQEHFSIDDDNNNKIKQALETPEIIGYDALKNIETTNIPVLNIPV